MMLLLCLEILHGTSAHIGQQHSLLMRNGPVSCQHAVACCLWVLYDKCLDVGQQHSLPMRSGPGSCQHAAAFFGVFCMISL